MGSLWRAIFDRDVDVSNLRRVGTTFEVDVEIKYDVSFGPFPEKRYLYCRGVGASWEYFRPHCRNWVDVPEWLKHEINAEIVRQLTRKSDNVIPMKKPA